MADIVIFPGEDARYKLQIEKIIEESLNISNPDVMECIKQRVVETMSKYKTIPSFSVTADVSMSEKDAKVLGDALQAEYSKNVSEFARTMVTDMCVLQAKLCKCEHGELP